ncbi:hypothetical protein GTP23_21170 [Pseudoduganella sp. FT93W]|uniref:TniQ domain-containing protein n=1 Tax=Duganella fentianensis TaxID=2692177 RepID=A0A845I313_9BURK|nr:TniQ family protein [Duganella fentianensis]MYN47562.1 hypothetical protein [Duganella fentianensis]
MPVLPQPYPDEVIGSVIGRAAYHGGLPMKRLVQSLFGDTRSCVSFLMASKLPEIGRFTGMDPEEVLVRHTMYPYAVAYIPKKEQGKLRSKILLPGERECIGSLTKNVSHGVSHRRFCPLCLAEDLAELGESYWRRSHQLPGVLTCSRHQEPLIGTAIRLRDNVHLRTIALPQDAKRTVLSIPVNAEIAQTLQTISLNALNSLVPPRNDWATVYRTMAAEKGYARNGGDISTRHMSQDLAQFFGPTLLKDAGCTVAMSSLQPWPSLMVRESIPQNFATPKHIFFHAFCTISGSQTRDFSYARPGKKTLDFPKADAKGLRQLEHLLSSEAAQDKRFTVKELLQAIGLWQPFRHNRQQFPLLSERIERFKASNQSERQTGLRPYWRERLRSRKSSKSTEGATS